MNFFYKETGKKQVHYFRNSKTENTSLFNGQHAAYKNGSTVKASSSATMLSQSPKKLFRFSILTIDLLCLNLITILLLQVLDPTNENNQPLLITTNLAWIVSSYITALYFGKERFVVRTIQAYFLYISLTLLLIFLFKSNFSRFFVLFNFACFGLTMTLSRAIFIGAFFYIQNSMLTCKYIVLGYNDLSHKLVNSLADNNRTHKMEGYFDDYVVTNTDVSFPLLGSLNDCLDFAIKNQVDEIYSTIPPESNPEIYNIAHQAESNFIRFRFVPDFSVFINKRVHISFIENMPVLSLRQEPLEDLGSRFKKRVFDIAFSSIMILFVLSWLVPIIAILIKIDSRGPVFFKQLRSGKNNMPFLCFKFRSLTVNEESDSKQVTRNDSRYTTLGKFLRKTNLDEFPQFFNVFQGYMSVVGPRPHMLKHTQQYSEVINQYMIRHYVKPGLTGLAQVNGYRGEITKEEDLSKRIEMDIRYMENWSMLLDIKIIFKTLFLSIKGDKNAF